MKKNISYIVLTAIIIGIIVVTQPWKLGRTLHNEGTDTTAVQLENCLPAEGKESIRIVPVKTCIYMENSGSMDGYVNLNSEFKDALGKIIVKSNNCSSSTDLFFVNDAIYDVQQTALKGDINNFVSQLNASNMKVGATGSSNINKIFKMVLDKTVNDTVSILFSDFVYSIKGTDVSSQISNAKNATMGAFMDAIKRNPDFATIILQCSSQFQGKYYDRNDHPIPFVGTRPYYIFIMGPYDKLKYLDEKLALNNSNTGIPGLTNKYLLSSKTWTLDENTVQALTTSYTNSLLIKPDRNGFDIDFFKFDHSNSNWDFAYALGLSNLFVDGSYLTDKNNYEVEPGDVSVIKAEYTKDPAALSEVAQFSSPLVLQFSMERTVKTPNMKVRLINKIPAWVSAADVADDQGAVPSPTQTFAIGSLIAGVYEAYQSQTSGKPIFEFEVKINKYK